MANSELLRILFDVSVSIEILDYAYENRQYDLVEVELKVLRKLVGNRELLEELVEKS